jgi:hypothetical protein
VIIKSISKELLDNTYINELFSGLLLERHHLVKFHLLYQVIEMLIERIFNREFSEIITKYNPSGNLFEMKEKLNSLANEKDRVRKLFSSEYLKQLVSGNDLKNKCNELLVKFESKGIKNAEHSALYSVRSLIVHNYRQLSNKERELVEAINDEFENVLFEIISHYNEESPIEGDLN